MTDTTPASLEDIAARIPSMGGHAIGDRLRRAAAEVEEGHSIVEVGSWLGSGTAYLALGVRDSGRDIPLHSFDEWRCRATHLDKARAWGVEFRENQDTLPWVREALAPFGVPIQFHQGDIEKVRWTEGDIGLFVLDAAKEGEPFLYTMQTFGPHMVPGKTVLYMMDFHYYQSKPDGKFTDQRDFFAENTDYFEPIEYQVDNTSCAVFRYVKPMDYNAAAAAFRAQGRTSFERVARQRARQESLMKKIKHLFRR
ncbi:class I SAM-dependent methyltransferase [Fodinicurvata fenggangensis]|uniref:class I SAM-dependent methyltransferase n=1 Tax=Fodinicurvata fenggangensis TaxID=1121830 RepID=UPI0006914827|nr:class I SAM-dependent methyltransferase [Fodinicurvata fenggangensis]